MTQNSSPHWDRSRPEEKRPKPAGQKGPSDPYTELFAALDRADVSEAVRSAFAHALNPPPVGPVSGNADPRRRYTLHLTFPAGSLTAARSAATAYAEALTVLRPELSTSPALLSRADQWNHIEPIICGKAGPEGETCARTTDHLGCHRDSATGGLCWDDNEPANEPTSDPTDHPTSEPNDHPTDDDGGHGDPTDHL
nr:hypothetical protein [Micromonospora sp. DSM 115978]